MAENPREHRSKIPVPQYSRTTTPILSTDYGKVLREVKIKRAEIEVKEQFKDGIHQTPLTLSLHKNHINTAKFLLEIGVNVSEIFFKETASPLEIAKVKNMDILVAMIEIDNNMRGKSPIFSRRSFNKFLKTITVITKPKPAMIWTLLTNHHQLRPQTTLGFLTLTLEAKKNTVTIQGYANRCHTPGAGDFHNRGYVNECLARFAGQGVFWHVVEKVLRRPTVNPQSFKKKFKDNNYNNNEEALADYEDGISIHYCNVKGFSRIIMFSNTSRTRRVSSSEQVTQCKYAILLQTFYEWSKTIQTDKMADYHMKLANQILPIRRWYKSRLDMVMERQSRQFG